MDSKKFQIFVSSTYADLKEVRLGVMEMIQRSNHFPVGMEQFSADDDEQWQIIKETLEQTDYYICIVGHRYGSLSEDGRSYTEKEWDYAQELGIPIMSFVRLREVPTKPNERDSDPKQIERLDTFIEKVKKAKMVDSWTDANDLNQKVIAAIFKAFSRKPRLGWIRAQSGQVAEQLANLVEENRVLRNQVERLTSEIKHTKPKLEILINGGNNITINHIPDEQIKLTNIPFLAKVNWNEVPEDLHEFITKEEVERYNREIANLEDIETRVSDIRKVERCKINAVPLIISISNIGTAKARQVYVELVFPRSVTLLTKDEFDEIEAPRLTLPDNPLARALSRMAVRHMHSLYSYRGIPTAGESLGVISGIINAHAPISKIHDIAPRSRSLRTEGNKMTIWLEDLMHTREQVFREAVIIPVQAGEFEILGTVICEEIETKYPLTIPLIILEDNIMTSTDTANT